MVQVPETPPSERYPGRPEGGRIVVIAPTRAACETIEMGVGLTGIRTVLQEEHGDEIRRLAAAGKGFGIVAGTGTGKTLAIRPIAEELVGLPLRTGVVNREREATPDTPSWNVVIITTGIARRWLQDDLIGPEDTIIVDEIHQTSAELELCLALGKRAGCRFIWLSATVDPSFYAQYLDSAEIIESSAFDPSKAADVRTMSTMNPLAFLSQRFLRHVLKQKRGVAVFVPTRADTERIAETVGEEWDRIYTEFYHGGEPISKLRPFLEGDAPHPYLLSMTAAGQSALNIQGLDTVVIEDAQFTSVVERGRRVLMRLPLGANEILQMAGRVHGRVAGGEVYILSDRQINFYDLEPTAPNFQLAGDPERVALTCADMGVSADDLDLPVPLDRIAYRRAVEMLERRGIIANQRLTEYGRKVEVLPVDRPFAELLVQADDYLTPVVATCAAVDSLHRMTRKDRYIRDFIVPGSDHLTIYRLYEYALRKFGGMGSVYGLPRHVFDMDALSEWADDVGVLVRAIEDAALAIASIYRSIERPLPAELPRLNDRLTDGWRNLVARVMPFDLVLEEETSWGEQVRPSPGSVCGSFGAIAGSLHYFSDSQGRTRGSIEGTQIPYDLIWRYAELTDAELIYDPSYPRSPLRVQQRRVYFGFDLDSEVEAVDVFPAGLEDQARRTLAEAMAAGATYHRDTRANRETFRELREVYRRSGGEAPPVTEDVLAQHFLDQLQNIGSYTEFQRTSLRLDPDQVIPRKVRNRWLALPDTITLNGSEYPLDYAIEDDVAFVRARIPEKVLWKIEEEDVPELDRPLRWTVMRGKKGAVRGDTLQEAKELAAMPPAAARRAQRERGKRSADDFDGRGPRGGGRRGGGGGRGGGRGRKGRGRKRGKRG